MRLSAVSTGSGGGGGGPQSVTLDAPSGEASEGIPFQLTGTILPAGYYSFEYTIEHNYGGFNYNPGTGAFSVWVLIPDDGPSPGNGTPSDIETITVNVYAVGQQSPTASDDVDVTVNNMTPTFIHPEYGNLLLIAIYDYPLGGPYFVVSGNIHDYGSQDQHTVTIDWGDGSYDEFPLQGSILATYRYAPDGGDYPITVTVTDDDGGIGSIQGLAPMYVLDLDNDAENDGDIDDDDDPIEHFDDLKPVKLTLDKKGRALTFWTLTFEHSTDLALWNTGAKEGRVTGFTIGVDEIPDTIYVEGVLQGQRTTDVPSQIWRSGRHPRGRCAAGPGLPNARPRYRPRRAGAVVLRDARACGRTDRPRRRTVRRRARRPDGRLAGHAGGDSQSKDRRPVSGVAAARRPGSPALRRRSSPHWTNLGPTSGCPSRLPTTCSTTTKSVAARRRRARATGEN